MMKRSTDPGTSQPLPCAYNDECRQAGCSSCRGWGDVESSLLKMDSLYGASFTSWLKNEENVMVTASYLQRVCNEYCFPRILAAIRWLEGGWKADSTAWLLRHITQHWGTGNRCSTDKVDVARATFVQCLMEGWSKAKRAEFVPAFLDLAYPSSSARRLVFLRTLFEKFDFKDLSELFSIMGGGLDYSTKVLLLQEAARRDSLKLTTKRRQATQAPSPPKRSKCVPFTTPPPASSNRYSSSLGLVFSEGEPANSSQSPATIATTSPPSSSCSSSTLLRDQLDSLFEPELEQQSPPSQLQQPQPLSATSPLFSSDYHRASHSHSHHHRPTRMVRNNTEDNCTLDTSGSSSSNSSGVLRPESLQRSSTEFGAPAPQSPSSSSSEVTTPSSIILPQESAADESRASRTCPGSPATTIPRFHLSAPHHGYAFNANPSPAPASGTTATQNMFFNHHHHESDAVAAPNQDLPSKVQPSALF